jgi:L-alanine-DL-glutamate epimerase-like enolase superfamily enzyme
MRIRCIRAYTADLEYAGEAYAFSHGRRYTRFRTTVVRLETDTGLVGTGEICPCGPAYMDAYAEGIVPALALLAPAVLGADPRQTECIARAMDMALAGHAAAKTPIDLACWDLLGQAAGLPVCDLLGGRLVEDIPLHRVVPLGTPEAMAARVERLRDEGFRTFQVKLDGDPEEDAARMRAVTAARRPGEVFVGDANGAWRRDEAIRVSAMLEGIDCILEQPCADTGACLAVRPHLRHPLKLDESLTDTGAVLQALQAEALDAAAIKLSRYGGLTRSRVVRDLCVAAGVALTIEEAWGGAVASAAAAHLAASTAPECLLNGTDIHNYNRNDIATGAPEASHGHMRVGDGPGLGVAPDWDALGAPAFEAEA